MFNIFKPKLPPNFELLELETVCRICLHTGNNLLPLFVNEIDFLISEFLPQKILREPLQPHQICGKCFEEAKIAYIFKKQCEYSDELIKSILNEPSKNNNTIKSLEKQTQTDINNYVYPCEKCEKTFDSFENLRKHRLNEHFKTQNNCRKCGKIFKKICALRNHLGSVHPELGFTNNNKCHLCNKNFNRKYHLDRHLINIHSVNEKLKIKSKNVKINKVSEVEEHTFDEIGQYDFSCGNCFDSLNSEDDVKSQKCSKNLFHSNILEADSTNKFLELTVDIDKVKENLNSPGNDIERNPLFEDNSKTDGENDEESFKTNPEIQVKNENKLILGEFKATQEILKSMIRESKKKIPKVKVKPNADGNYVCEICQKVFTRAAHLTRHQLIHSGDPKPYACTMCSKSFSRPDHLKNHVNGFHADLRLYKCLTCEKSFTRNEHLKRHILICSTGIKRRRKEKLFSCEICLRKFSSEKYVQDHIDVKHNETGEFACKYCGEKIIGSTEYKKHCKKHYNATSKQFLCSECGGSFTKLQYLMIHIRRHTGEKPYKCRYCDKAFPRTTDQYAHERSHTGEKNFHCTNCPKAFSTAYKLRVHMRIHTGERPYKCLYCPKAFAQNNDLKAHHRRHTGERFYCNICDVGFVQMYLLRQHKRQAHGIDEPRGRTSLLDKVQVISEDQSVVRNLIMDDKISNITVQMEQTVTNVNHDIKNEIIVCGLDS